MDDELKELLDRASREISSTPEQIEESDIRMAVANGIISDDRVTIDVFNAVRAVDRARVRSTKKEVA